MKIFLLLPVIATAEGENELRWRRVSRALCQAARLFRLQFAVSLLFMVTSIFAQELPVGTAIPVMLNSGINAKKDKVGQKLEGKVKQEIALPSGSKIKSGSQVRGHIVDVTPAAAGGSRVVVTFDTLDDHGRAIPLAVSLRAVASFESVYQARLPIGASSNSEVTDEWVTRQVGGDVVNRGRGAVASNAGIVGRWSGGVWAKLTPAPQAGCPAEDDNESEQSLWIFSTSACGAYGLRDLKLAHTGRTDPVGMITLESTKDLLIRGGSGWLLLVTKASSASAAKH
jgi:hypothetical protein